ncbi:alpha/beta hydrolase [Cellulomonas sp. Sa3CUA2]|uniref:Alpha/beta hydrolase n=1 Tax=Cellulomonas avistercoris TaxID=2762242 RepID=A0ABR8Q9T3_9CELL|nr:alpha/beta hydrolase [Cellulomonas avistercoris]MBD7917178.1 alpha/beta hydrolase [Cellulomonas avistercoris]
MSHTSKQTIVLVHGAYADSSSWNGSVTALLEAGHHVIAVANPLRSIEGDAAYLRSVLDSIDGPIVIAGHSYGGVVMSHAADGHPGVTALVYVASFLAEPGETLVDLVTKFPGARLGDAAQPVLYPTPDGSMAPELYIDQARFHELFAGDVDPEVAQQMAVTQRPLALAAFEAPSTRAAWKSIESWVVAAQQDLAVPAGLSRFMADRADAHLVEVDASHAVTVSQPGVVTDVILQAAEKSAR